MIKKHQRPEKIGLEPLDLSNDDILAAMRSIQGYIDITPSDFIEIYGLAYKKAIERLSNLVKAEDIMTKDVIFVYPDTLLSETAHRMALSNVSGVPVINEEKKVIGVISEKDFLVKMGNQKTGSFMYVIEQCLSKKGCLTMPISGETAKDIMTAPPITARPDETVSELSRKLTENNINRIPIATDEGKLIGIVSRGDIVDSYFERAF